MSLGVLSSVAAADEFTKDFGDAANSVEIGGGVALPGSVDGTVDALIRVDVSVGERTSSTTRFVWARIKGDVSGNQHGVGYIDVQFELATFGAGWRGNFGEISVLNGKILRNVNIDNAAFVRLSVLGLRGGAESRISPTSTAFINASLDLLSLSMAKRYSDGDSIWGYGPAGSVEGGFEFSERFRIALGEKVETALASPETYYDGSYYCTGYDDGYVYTGSCRPGTSTWWNERRVSSQTYLSLTAKLTQHLSLFGQASYNVYSVGDDTGRISGGANDELRFMFGAAGRW